MGIQAERKSFVDATAELQSVGAERVRELVGIRDAYLADRVFAVMDRGGHGKLGRDQFYQWMKRLQFGSPEERLGFVFELHDADGDGYIDEGELTRLLQSSVLENGLALPEEEVRRLSVTLLSEADADGDGRISLGELRLLFGRHPEVLDAMALGTLRWVERCALRRDAPQIPAEARSGALVRSVRNHLGLVGLAVVYLMANAMLFAAAVYAYRASGTWVQLARGCGACLNLNGALILMPMMRGLASRLRGTFAEGLLPLDHQVSLHMIVGNVMMAFAAGHAVFHVVHALTTSGLGALGTPAGVTGLVLLAVMTAMWLTSLPWIRRHRHFDLFWAVHTLYMLWLALMLVHGPSFWMWVALPLIGYVVDRVYRSTRKKWTTRLVGVHLLPGRVTKIIMEKPAGFSFRAGEYVQVRLPLLAKHEWHPFTLSSAPEDDELTVHVRSAGDWTSALHEEFSRNVHLYLARKDGVEVCLEGPYGTPVSSVEAGEVLVLIGAGIGVTPFASILRSLQAQTRDGGFRKKVYFHWLARDRESFGWFSERLGEVEEQDTDGLFELHLHLTGLRPRSDLKSSVLHIALDLRHRQDRVDLLTGMRKRTGEGRPDWNAIFDRIESLHPSENKTVLYCGPPSLRRTLARHCYARGMRFSYERF